MAGVSREDRGYIVFRILPREHRPAHVAHTQAFVGSRVEINFKASFKGTKEI